MSLVELIGELRQLLVASLRLPHVPEQISADLRLFGGELGLDSVDAVELVQAVERRFHITISDGDLARYPIATLRDFAALLEAKGLATGTAPPESGIG